MLNVAFYGKGGIGKSTTCANCALALAKSGKRVLHIGCDPKADSTRSLHPNIAITRALTRLQEHPKDSTLDDILYQTSDGIYCVESGGPTPGLGCAGRGIGMVLEFLHKERAVERLKIDCVLYDVLGDVVCGGFSMPMRGGYADKVYIVTSGENMAIHAAANIAVAVENFRDRGYASLGGIILNRRDVKDERQKVEELCSDIGSRIVGTLSRSETVQDAEARNATVIEAYPCSGMAEEYRVLARAILSDCGVEK